MLRPMLRIKAERIVQGLTQRDLGERAKLSQTLVSRIERGHLRSAEYTVLLAEALGMDPAIALDEVALDVTLSEEDLDGERGTQEVERDDTGPTHRNGGGA